MSHPAEPLPTSPTALEGLLNQHASQLQKLADRVDSINESIDLDNIVLHRHKREQLAPKGDANGNGTGMIKSKIHEVMVMGPSPGIMELERRLRAARTYKKELERSVLFHRNEYRRVESAMGKKRGSTMHHGMGQRNNSSIGKMLQTGATGKENGVMVVESRVQEGPRDGGGNGNGGAAPHVDEEWSRGWYVGKSSGA